MAIRLDERGMTFIEVLVALVLLTVILLPLVGTLTTGFIVTGEGAALLQLLPWPSRKWNGSWPASMNPPRQHPCPKATGWIPL